MKTLKKSFGLFLLLTLSMATLSLQSCGGTKAEDKSSENTSSSKNESAPSKSDDKAEATTEKSSGGSSSCAQIAEDYGKFVDEYVSILKKYTKDPTNTAILADYTTYIQKLEKVTSNLDANKDCNSDMTFMAEILKHNQRMATAATQK
jgi:hypothetical protein